jgi:hypothetical protein
MGVYINTGKGTPGMDKCSSKVHKVLMELGGKTQFLDMLQLVGVVDGAAHTQKDDVESDGGSLQNVAKVTQVCTCAAYNE